MISGVCAWAPLHAQPRDDPAAGRGQAPRRAGVRGAAAREGGRQCRATRRRDARWRWAVHLGERRMAEGAARRRRQRRRRGRIRRDTGHPGGGQRRCRHSCERLLTSGGNARAARWNGETALMIAAGAGSLETVRQLVRHGADVNAAEPRGGQTALMWAAAEGHDDVVSGLIGMGANVNAASKAGFHADCLRRDQGRRARNPHAAHLGREPERRPGLRRQATDCCDAVPAHGGGAGAARRRRRHHPARSRRQHGAASGVAGGRPAASFARSWPRASIRTSARRNRRRRRERGAAAVADAAASPASRRR